MVIATSESVSIVRSSSGGLASSAKAIPVSSGRVDELLLSLYFIVVVLLLVVLLLLHRTSSLPTPTFF